MRKIKGFTLIELLIVVAIIAILAAIAVPNFLEAQTRSKVSRVKADQRSLATALESYYIDNNQYPAWASSDTTNISPPPNMTINANYDLGTTSIQNHRSFAITPPGAITMMTVTTPIAYITAYPRDPFAKTRGATHGYYSDPTQVGWILYSFGPDNDESEGADLHTTVNTVYLPYITQPSLTLITGGVSGADAYTYDPTNGSTSPGDVYRVKQ